MTIKLELLRSFITVAECGNLLEAGERLHRSPSAISMQLKQLEEHLGVPLFAADRKNELSVVGQFVYAQSQQEITRFDQLIQSIEAFARTGTGEIRIASVPSVAGTVLPVAFERFVRQFPDVRLNLRDMDSVAVEAALNSNDVDLGIATVSASEIMPDNSDADSLRRAELFSDEFVVVCQRGHALENTSGAVQWDRLQGESFIGNPLCATIELEDFQAIYRHASITVHNIVSLLAMVKSGVGITVLPQTVLRLFPNDFLCKPVGDIKARRTIALLRRSGSGESRALETLCAMIHEAASEFR